MTTDRYILDEHGTPVPCEDLLEWARWFEQAKRDRRNVIAQDRDESGDTRILISTVFLALDYNLSQDGPPLLWETMVFGGVLDGAQDRYHTRDEAFRGHQAMCARVRETMK
jgi:hypothetical protein